MGFCFRTLYAWLNLNFVFIWVDDGMFSVWHSLYASRVQITIFLFAVIGRHFMEPILPFFDKKTEIHSKWFGQSGTIDIITFLRLWIIKCNELRTISFLPRKTFKHLCDSCVYCMYRTKFHFELNWLLKMKILNSISNFQWTCFNCVDQCLVSQQNGPLNNIDSGGFIRTKWLDAFYLQYVKSKRWMYIVHCPFLRLSHRA